MSAKKILNCSRALVVLLAITMGFTIAMYKKSTNAPEQPTLSSSELGVINSKLDRLAQESRERDTILLQQIIGIRQQLQQGQGNQGRIAEVFDK